MSEFIEGFGKQNFLIIAIVVGVIILSLITIIVIEKINNKKAKRKEIKRQIKDYEQEVNQEKKASEIPVFVEQETKQEEVLEDTLKPGEVVYVEKEPTQEEAKEKLEEVTRKLIEEQEPIEHTEFENEQEEKSIISYEELLNVSKNTDYENSKVLSDEDEAAITIDELYKKYDESSQETVPPKQNETSFKNSEVISPVFGVYNQEKKQETKKENMFKNSDELGMKNLEDEIAKTQDFLEELKRLRNKLD